MVLAEVLGISRGAAWEGQSRVQIERQQEDLRHMPLLESVGEVLWSSWSRARLINSY